MNLAQLPFSFSAQQLSQIETWKLELSKRLNDFCVAADNFNESLENAKKYIHHSVSELSGYSLMTSVLKDWLKDVCKQASTDAHNETHIRISIDNLASELRDFTFPESREFFSADEEMEPGKRFFDASNQELADWMIANFDFDKLDVEINKIAETLNNAGLRDAANTLGEKLGLLRSNIRSGSLELKMQKGRYNLDYDHYGNWVHDRVGSLNSLCIVARTFEKEANVNGLSYCLRMAIEEEKALAKSYDCYVPSRTKIATDSNVSGTFFNQKIRLAFEPEFFESLIAFIQEFSNKELKEITIK